MCRLTVNKPVSCNSPELMLRIGPTIYDMKIDITRTNKLWVQRKTMCLSEAIRDVPLVSSKINILFRVR